MKNLESLDLSYNKIKMLHPNLFSKNRSLISLNISNNFIENESYLRCIYKLKHLERVDLSVNKLYNLSFSKLLKYIKKFSQGLRYLKFR